MKASPVAGHHLSPSALVNVPKLVTAYYAEVPDASVRPQRVAFGTSGHRGSSLHRAFNERHILAITQAICLCRKQQQIDGPLFLGMDTHALSVPALVSALEVLAANGVEVSRASASDPGRSSDDRELRIDGSRSRSGATMRLLRSRARLASRARSPSGCGEERS